MKTVNSNITAVILAGGKGSRLQGNDKGLVLFNSKPLIEHILQTISPQVSTILINANRNQATYARYGYPVINDEISGFQGPLAGFATAMHYVDADYILTLPCDGPFLSNDYVTRLANTLEESKAELVVAHDGERMQPVHALIPVTLLDSLEHFLQSGDRKVAQWYAQHNYAFADFSDTPEIFNNINTKEQLNAYQENANPKKDSL